MRIIVELVNLSVTFNWEYANAILDGLVLIAKYKLLKSPQYYKVLYVDLIVRLYRLIVVVFAHGKNVLMAGCKKFGLLI